MKLPIPFRTNKKEEENFYLAMLLTDEKASAVILHEIEGKIKIVGKHEAFFSGSIEEIPQEELIEVVDKTISKAEEVLPPNIETHKTVFGVKGDWIEEETKKIKKEYLTKLKKVCDSLDLSPIGFMVITEAISHLLQEEEGAPLSAILAEVGKQSVTITLIRGGKILETLQGPLEGGAPTTVDTLLKHLTIAVLPARIILSDSDTTELVTQQFITHQWTKSLPFLHMPQITILPHGFDGRAITFGAASQMGFEVLNLEKTPPIEVSGEQFTKKGAEGTKEPEETASNTAEAKEIEELEETQDEPPVSPIQAENFGFVLNQDISNVPPELHPHKPHEPNKHAHGQHDEHSPHSNHSTHHAGTKHHVAPEETKMHQPHEESEMHSLQSDRPDKKPFAFPALSLPKFKLPAMSLGNNPLLIKTGLVLALLLVLIGGLVYFYFYQMQATVTVALTPKMAQETKEVTFSATSPSDFSKNIIAAKSLSEEISGEVSTAATGKKEIGDKAKGKVTLYNNETKSTKLSADTEIKSGNGLVFLLEKDVTIASASGDIFSGTKPGTTDVNVVAKEIGTESNLPSGTKFTLSGNIAAKNESAFSGGSKKSVTVVSKDDLTKLRAELPKSLQDKAKDTITAKAGSDESVLPFFFNSGLSKESVDKKVGSEAKQVTLSGTVEFESLAYKNDDLKAYAQSVLKSKNTQDISFAENSIKATVSDTKQQDDRDIRGKVAIEGGLLPKINAAEIEQQLKDKSLQQAKEKLTTLPQIGQSTITFSPNIPFLPTLFPKLPNKITVVIQTHE